MSSSKKLKRNDSQLSFSRIHVPKMRSVFWKYFGFPATENDEIITKQKVVCTLCNVVLRNHFNTTNIRAHMQSNHKTIFAELLATHGIQIPPRKIQKKSSRLSITNEETMMCEDSQLEVKQEKTFISASINEDTVNLLEEIPLTYEDTDRISKDQETSDGETTNIYLEQTTSHTSTKKRRLISPMDIKVGINPIQMPIEHMLGGALRKMIITDLLNVSSIYSCGMQELVTGFFSSQVLPPISAMESAIKELHDEKFVKLKDRIKVHSQVKFYSLSFDVWTNVENKQFVTIYFNNISEEFENHFCDNLFLTAELNDYTAFNQIFEDFNLKNCSAAVINCNHKILNTFLSNNDIPIVYCFSYIVNTCMENVFSIPDVSSVLKDVQNIMARYASEICIQDVEIPTICNEFPLTKFYLLKFFCENVSWPEEIDISKAKHILDAISPLEVSLDTLKEEDIPLSSLFLPFANKIIEKHFAINEYDDSTIQEIKAIVITEFETSVVSNNHLAVTALLDPRFHNFLSVKNINTCKNLIEKKFSKINKQRGCLQKIEPTPEDRQKSSKKSHLKMFFDCMDKPTKQLNHLNESHIESDLRRYREEACASWDESLLMWWNRWGSIYGSLVQVVDAYSCILGFVNMSCKNSLKDQISYSRKRFMLTGKLIDQITFLNKNYE